MRTNQPVRGDRQTKAAIVYTRRAGAVAVRTSSRGALAPAAHPPASALAAIAASSGELRALLPKLS